MVTYNKDADLKAIVNTKGTFMIQSLYEKLILLEDTED